MADKKLEHDDQPLLAFDSMSQIQEIEDVAETKTKKTEEDELVEDPLKFENGICALSIGQLSSIALKTIFTVFALAPASFSKVVITMSGLIIFNLLNDQKSQALFGIFSGYYQLFYTHLLNTLLDKFCIGISKAFGDHNPERAKTLFSKSGVTTVFYFCVFTIPGLMFSSHALEFLKIDALKAAQVQTLTRLCIPFAFINFISEWLKSISLCQGYEKVFGITSFCGLFLSVPANYLFIYKLELGIKGWIITKTLYELFCLVVAAVVYCRLNPAKRGLASFEATFTGIIEYFWDSFKFILSVYPEVIGFQTNLYFIALRGDDDQIAAYNCTMNIASVLIGLAVVFSIVCRSRLNTLLGLRNFKAAKNYYVFYMTINCLVGGLIGLCLYLVKEPLAGVFADSSEKMRFWFFRLLTIYSIFAFFEIALLTAPLGLKSLNKINTYLVVSLIVPFGGSIVIGYAIYKTGFHSDAQLLNYMILCSATNLGCFLYCICAEWSPLNS